MKNIILAIIAGLVLTSCGGREFVPKFEDPSKPFIVRSVEYIGNGMCEYTGFSNGVVEDIFVAPIGKFEIGDTVKLCK